MTKKMKCIQKHINATKREPMRVFQTSMFFWSKKEKDFEMNVEALADALSHLAERLGFFSRTAKIRDTTQLISLSNQFRLL